MEPSLQPIAAQRTMSMSSQSSHENPTPQSFVPPHNYATKSDKIVYCKQALHLRDKLQTASFKGEVEKWDTDSDSQESDMDEEQTRSRRCCSDARARRRGEQGGEDVWCGTLVVR